jgi:hypothetical protein
MKSLRDTGCELTYSSFQGEKNGKKVIQKLSYAHPYFRETKFTPPFFLKWTGMTGGSVGPNPEPPWGFPL